MVTRIYVENIDQVLEVAKIRNTGRENMTHYKAHISDQEQLNWWFSLDKSRHHIYLYHNGVEFVGFGMLKLDASDQMWATLAVYPELRGKGYGTAIYKDLVFLSTGQDLWIEVLNHNQASIIAAANAGFMYQWHNPQFTVLAVRRQR